MQNLLKTQITIIFTTKLTVLVIHILEFGVAVIKLLSTWGSNCSSRASQARLLSSNYCLSCFVIWLLLPQTPRICILFLKQDCSERTTTCVYYKKNSLIYKDSLVLQLHKMFQNLRIIHTIKNQSTIRLNKI